jgi:hypothetical protein
VLDGGVALVTGPLVVLLVVVMSVGAELVLLSLEQPENPALAQSANAHNKVLLNLIKKNSNLAH